MASEKTGNEWVNSLSPAELRDNQRGKGRFDCGNDVRHDYHDALMSQTPADQPSAASAPQPPQDASVLIAARREKLRRWREEFGVNLPVLA